jgi:hypothetical protein
MKRSNLLTNSLVLFFVLFLFSLGGGGSCRFVLNFDLYGVFRKCVITMLIVISLSVNACVHGRAWIWLF